MPISGDRSTGDDHTVLRRCLIDPRLGDLAEACRFSAERAGFAGSIADLAGSLYVDADSSGHGVVVAVDVGAPGTQVADETQRLSRTLERAVSTGASSVVVVVGVEGLQRSGTSTSAHQDALHGWVQAYTRHLAVEAAPVTRVNCVAVAGLARLIVGQRAAAPSLLAVEVGAGDVADAVAFLLSNDASYITATTLRVDGGLSSTLAVGRQ